MTTRDRRLRGLTPAKAGNAGALADWENEGGSLPAPPLDPRDREDAPGGRGRHPRRVRRSALEREVRQGAMQLRRAEEKFRTLVENLPDVVTRFDPHLRHLYVSPGIQRVAGWPLQDCVGKTNRELGMPSELVEVWDAALLRVFATGQPERIELALPAPDGTRKK